MHKHCIFCGAEVPVPRPTNWNMVCESPLNTTLPDTVGKRYHAVIVGSAKNETRVVPQSVLPSDCETDIAETTRVHNPKFRDPVADAIRKDAAEQGITLGKEL